MVSQFGDFCSTVNQLLDQDSPPKTQRTPRHLPSPGKNSLESIQKNYSKYSQTWRRQRTEFSWKNLALNSNHQVLRHSLSHPKTKFRSWHTCSERDMLCWVCDYKLMKHNVCWNLVFRENHVLGDYSEKCGACALNKRFLVWFECVTLVTLPRLDQRRFHQ